MEHQGSWHWQAGFPTGIDTLAVAMTGLKAACVVDQGAAVQLWDIALEARENRLAGFTDLDDAIWFVDNTLTRITAILSAAGGC